LSLSLYQNEFSGWLFIVLANLMFESVELNCSSKEIGIKPVSTVNTKAMLNSRSCPRLVSVFDRSDENSVDSEFFSKEHNKNNR